jgi:hypothetical protein
VVPKKVEQFNYSHGEQTSATSGKQTNNETALFPLFCIVGARALVAALNKTAASRRDIGQAG